MTEEYQAVISALQNLQKYRHANGQSIKFLSFLENMFSDSKIQAGDITPERFIKSYQTFIEDNKSKSTTLLTFNEFEVLRVLKEVAEKTFPDKTIKYFKISIQCQESKTRHGEYNHLSKEIKIFNLSRKTAHIIKTSLHELAHHCECCFFGDSGHSKRFYEIYKRLLEKAHELGWIDLQKTTDQIDSRDLQVLVKHCGPLRYLTQAHKKESYIIKVFNSYEYKNLLNDRGYTFSSTEKAWVKEFKEIELAVELEFLKENTPQARVESVRLDNYEIQSVYYLIIGKNVPGTKEAIQKDGFFYNDKWGWVKKIPAKDKTMEELNVKTKYRIKPLVVGNLS